MRDWACAIERCACARESGGMKCGRLRAKNSESASLELRCCCCCVVCLLARYSAAVLLCCCLLCRIIGDRVSPSEPSHHVPSSLYIEPIMSRRTLLVCVALAALLCACHTDARRSASNSIQAGDFVVSLTNIATDPLPSFTISLESALTEGFTVRTRASELSASDLPAHDRSCICLAALQLVWQKLCEATLQPPTAENPFYSLVETPNSDVFFSGTTKHCHRTRARVRDANDIDLARSSSRAALAWDSSGIWETPQAAGWSFTIPSNTGVWSNLTIGASVLTETETSHVKLDIGLDSYTWYKNDSDTWLVLEAEFYGPPDEVCRARYLGRPPCTCVCSSSWSSMQEMRADDATIFISAFGAYVLSLDNATVTTAGGEPVPVQTLLIPLSSQVPPPLLLAPPVRRCTTNCVT